MLNKFKNFKVSKLTAYVMILSGVSQLNASFANADNFKFAYVDVAKIFSTAKPAVAVQSSLKAQFEPTQTELKKLNENLQKEQSQIEAIEKTAPSPDKLTKTNKDTLEKLVLSYQKDQQTLQQKYAVFQQTVQKIQDYASALLLSKINAVIKKLSDKGDYDLILTSNQMVYAKAKYDITDQVIDNLKSVNTDELIKQIKTAQNTSATK